MKNTTKAAQIGKQAVDQSELDAINRFTLRELGEEEVFTFSLAACDNQIDRDDERFSDATLNELAGMYPGKPVLLDHNWSAKDQSGRVYAAEVREDGENTLLILSLTEAAQKYTAEMGQLLQNESRPYLHLTFRE